MVWYSIIISETEQIHCYLLKSRCSLQCSRNNPLTAMKIPWEQSPFDPPRKVGRRKDFSRRIERTLLAGYYENKTKQNKTEWNIRTTQLNWCGWTSNFCNGEAGALFQFPMHFCLQNLISNSTGNFQKNVSKTEKIWLYQTFQTAE